jgi:hypothetical protein
MFSFILFLCLVSSLLSLAPISSPLPSDIDLRRSFQTRARCRASLSHSLTAFNLDTDRFPHTTPSNLSPAGHSLSTFVLFSPPFSLSLRSVQCIATDSDSAYKYQKPCFAERQATAAQPFPFSFVCVSGQPWPFLSLVSSLRLRTRAFRPLVNNSSRV